MNRGPQHSPAHFPAPGGERWTARAGPWLGIGASPAAMVLGAGLAARHDGPVALLALVLGLTLSSAMLAAQGALGIGSPGGTLSVVAATMLPPPGRRGLDMALVVSMVGWLGFNLAVGGTALAAIAGADRRLGVVVYTLPVIALALGGVRRWNVVVLVATGTAVVLTAVVTARLGAATSPVEVAMAPDGVGILLADIAALAGYTAVFSVRAPDFTAGLHSRADVHRLVAMTVAAVALTSAAGILLYLGTGTQDLVGALSGPDGLPIGNMLVSLAFLAGSLTAVHSGGLAFASLWGTSHRTAIGVLGAVGVAVALSGFDRVFVSYLTLLGAAMP
ncbi:MAG TPA: hypothetical protein VMM13_02725, partial [Euzebya sp.]|nr:hypothetical protein [Euzebya sp.]